MGTRSGPLRSALPGVPRRTFRARFVGSHVNALFFFLFHSGQFIPGFYRLWGRPFPYSLKATRIRGIRHTVNGGIDVRVNAQHAVIRPCGRLRPFFGAWTRHENHCSRSQKSLPLLGSHPRRRAAGFSDLRGLRLRPAMPPVSGNKGRMTNNTKEWT